MATTRGAPTHNRFSHFRCETGTITDVDRKKWIVTVETKYTAKTVTEVQLMTPYHHFLGGEGFHVLPEVGATVLVAFPSDNSYPFVMGYMPVAAQALREDGAGEVAEEFGWRSRRPQMNPGDIGITTRDGNFLMLRRGGIVQVGATAMAQTVYIPIRNYIKQFCENYEMHTLGGDVEWRVDRAENDPSGQAPSTYVFHMQEFAQDAKASVRVRYYPSGQSADPKVVWDIAIAPQGIDRDTGDFSGEVYTMAVAMDGSKTEFLGANRKTTVNGDDTLEVGGAWKVSAGGTGTVDASGALKLKSGSTASLEGSKVALGSSSASSPVPKGDKLVQALASAQWIVGAGPAAGSVVTLNPGSVAALQAALSTKVFVS